MKEVNAGNTPYGYCSNNPISMVDPDGRLENIKVDFDAAATRKETQDPFMRYIKTPRGKIRFEGVLQTIDGIAQISGGVATAEIGVGWGLMINGLDEVQAGSRKIWTAEETPTLKYLAASNIAKYFGANEEEANNWGNGVSNGVNLVYNLNLAVRSLDNARTIGSSINGIESLGSARSKFKSWLQTAGDLEPDILRSDIQSAGFKFLHQADNGMEHYGLGNWTIRLDPPHLKGKYPTAYNHMHIERTMSAETQSFNVFLNPVGSKSPDAHIPIR